MSKIGKTNISIPDTVKVALSGNVINIEGPLGKKSMNIDLDLFNLNIKEGKEISIKPKKINQNSKRLWGMNRSLINNAIIGSSKGYEKTLELVGVGFRATLKGKQLNLQLGFSHDINFDIPEGVKISVEKQTIIKINGINKQEVGMIASKLKSIRPPILRDAISNASFEKGVPNPASPPFTSDKLFILFIYSISWINEISSISAGLTFIMLNSSSNFKFFIKLYNLFFDKLLSIWKYGSIW